MHRSRVAFLGSLVIVVALAANSYAADWEEIRQLTVERKDGNQTTFHMWRGGSAPWNSYFVELNGKWVKLKGTWSLGDYGPVVQSSDGSRVVMMSFEENSTMNGWEFDLRTGEAHRAFKPFQDWLKEGWQLRNWHTKFELKSDDQLFVAMPTINDDDFRVLLEELEIRGFSEMDWGNYLNAMFDSNLPESRRASLAKIIYDAYEKRHEVLEEHLDIGRSGDWRKPLAAAWIFCLYLDNPKMPAEFDLVASAKLSERDQGQIIAQIRHCVMEPTSQSAQLGK
jgi:hypothetical protein